MSTKVDIDHLRKWIGKIDNVTDYVTPIVEQRYRATLNMDIGNPKDGDPVTSGLHWMLGWNLVKNDELGVDSHPALGEFLPPVPLPRRMWAGSEIKVLKPIRVGDKVIKQSTVADIQVKEGRTGLLCFVTAEYNFLVNDEVTIIGKNSINLPLGIVKVTRPVKSLDIIIRTCTSVNMLTQNKNRLFEKEKIEYTLRTIRSLLYSVKSNAQLKNIKISFKNYLINDIFFSNINFDINM